MKVAVWKTGHEIADTVAYAICDGLCRIWFIDNSAHGTLLQTDSGVIINDETIDQFDIHIGYGILRGMSDVFKACDRLGKPYFIIDRGYWKPGHFDGYYRVSLNGTQQTTGLDKLEPDYARWDALGLEILPTNDKMGGSLLCPVTPHAKHFFRELDYAATVSLSLSVIQKPALIREKGCERSLQDDLDVCRNVVTFNSSVGWEALRQGIPVVSDPIHSIVGAYQKLVDKPLHLDFNERRKLFAIQASLQQTLSEMKEGLLWPLLKLLLSISDGIHVKP